MRIYICGPYGARSGICAQELEQNVAKAIEAGRQLITKGHNPFVPHLYHYVQNQGEHICDEDRWLEICLEWVVLCQGMLMLDGWRESTGARREWQYASAFGRQIFHSIDDVPDAMA